MLNQERAIAPAAPDEVKVVLATTFARSGLTLPDCDTVVCLGMQVRPSPFSSPPQTPPLP